MPIIKNQWSGVVAISQFIPILPLGIMFFLSACDLTQFPHPTHNSPGPQNHGNYQNNTDLHYSNTDHPQRGSEDLVLLCECGANRFVMGKGNSRRTAEQSAQGKCSLFSGSNSVKNCEKSD